MPVVVYFDGLSVLGQPGPDLLILHTNGTILHLDCSSSDTARSRSGVVLVEDG